VAHLEKQLTSDRKSFRAECEYCRRRAAAGDFGQLVHLEAEGPQVTSATLQFDVEVANPYDVALPLVNLDYRLSAGESRLLKGVADTLGAIPAHQSKIVTLPVVVAFDDVYNFARGVRSGTPIPYVADLNMLAAIRSKMRLTICDATTAMYDGGPGFKPERLWYPNALVVGEDRVALDHTAWGMIEKQRAAAGVPTLEAAGRRPEYIATAADAAHRLGTNDPGRIRLVEV